MNTEDIRPAEPTAELRAPLSGPSRRLVLAAGAGGGALVLAACSAAPGPTRSDVSTSGGSGSSGSAVRSAGAGQVLAPLSSVAVGSAIAAKSADGSDILISRTGPDTVAAFSAVCPHQGCTVAASFACPCHGSTFDPKTGARLSGPAQNGLATVAVAVSGGNIVAG
ncbi:Rieske (2Fe-2S) protein [Jatrophihabitans telluris]|uniref:Cytochrome bc1 complex Rieske iron-sulfur subunit n=1 Tax=Jatrophihabitans telluris TaxID=2038343 RepID=A0ABY4QTI2_9ACTN|nr:Rieske (2Fe-2S) protein [Jatrophihabitans telluris]UQX86654.1 Rieske (2Fe-2S) protein [Jatrophihabitans telluris]